jgi:hypothetical protein
LRRHDLTECKTNTGRCLLMLKKQTSRRHSPLRVEVDDSVVGCLPAWPGRFQRQKHIFDISHFRLLLALFESVDHCHAFLFRCQDLLQTKIRRLASQFMFDCYWCCYHLLAVHAVHWFHQFQGLLCARSLSLYLLFLYRPRSLNPPM